MAAVSAAARVATAARPPATRSRDYRPRRAGPATRAPPRRGVIAASSDADDAMKDEAAGAAMRAKESKEAGVDGKRPPRGGDPPPSSGGWEWTLNWDPICLDENGAARLDPSDAELRDASIIIGSCPRTPEDVDRLVDEAGVEAIVCLQCALCHGALKIDWDPIKKRALERGVLIVRVSVRDFDRLDQAKMLPEMVRKLALFQAMGKRTYVHCTAGINRASLTVLGYLTFVKGASYDDALAAVRECRPQANPYAVSWNIARARLLAE